MNEELVMEKPPRVESASLEDAYMRRDGDCLEFGNRFYRRLVDLSGGYPATISLTYASGIEYAAPKNGCDCGFIGINRPGYNTTDYRITEITAEPCANAVYDAPHLLIELHFTDRIQKVEFLREIFVYPGLPAHSVRNSVRSRVHPNLYWTHRGELPGPGNTPRYPEFHLESTGDSLRLADGFQPDRTVEFLARTDYNECPVIEHRVGGQSLLRGNLLYVKKDSSEAGFCILQEGMLSAEKRDFEQHDFRCRDGELFSCTWGISPSEFRLNDWMAGCRHTLIVFQNRDEAARNLQEYLKQRFPVRPHEHTVTVNPWGCGRFPQLVSEEFLQREIEAAAECGADIYQIDDSWQKGDGLASLMNNHCLPADFWDISQERLAGSFDNLSQCARRNEINLALWTAPSANTAFHDWREMADKLLSYHRLYGFKVIKIDGVQLRSHEAEFNLEKMLKTMREKSGNAIYFNLDVTNGQRGGYFRFLEYGSIFLENRYVNRDGTIGYHPEKTLRSLWLLSAYIRTASLQIEIPAPDDLVPAAYESSVRCRPDAYPLEYWAAIALFANPLLWFAPSTVSTKTRATVRRMMELHRLIRDEVFAGHVFPLGAEPNGQAITGFYADRGYLLFFRENGCKEERIELDLPLKHRFRAELLAGTGTLESISGKLMLSLPRRGSYVLFKLYGL